MRSLAVWLLVVSRSSHVWLLVTMLPWSRRCGVRVGFRSLEESVVVACRQQSATVYKGLSHTAVARLNRSLMTPRLWWGTPATRVPWLGILAKLVAWTV